MDLRLSSLTLLVVALISSSPSQVTTSFPGLPAPQKWVLIYSPPVDLRTDVLAHLRYSPTFRWQLKDDHPFRVVVLQCGWTAHLHPTTYGIDGLQAQIKFLKNIEKKVLASRTGEVELSVEEIESLPSAGLATTPYAQACLKAEPLTVWGAFLVVETSDGVTFGMGASGSTPTATPKLAEASQRLRNTMREIPPIDDLSNSLSRRQSTFSVEPVGINVPRPLMSTVIRQSDEAAKEWLFETEDLVYSAGLRIFESLAHDRYPFLSGMPRIGASFDQLPDSVQVRAKEYYNDNWRQEGFESQAEADRRVSRTTFRVRAMITLTMAERASTPENGVFSILSIRL